MPFLKPQFSGFFPDCSYEEGHLFMPRIKSSVKDVRKNRKQRELNKASMSTLKTALRKARSSSDEEKPATTKKAIKTIDKAIQNGLIPKNRGSRYKSRLTSTKKAA
jgi:small subunit ribosomal protein S20